jgi:hypothetical protein
LKKLGRRPFRTSAARSGGQGKDDAAIARFFAETVATAAPGLADAVTGGAEATLGLSPAALTG